ALCMSLLLMLIMSLVQRREDALLALLDGYCMENVLHKVRMSTPADSTSKEIASLTIALRELVDPWHEIVPRKDQVTAGEKPNGSPARQAAPDAKAR
ncbi:MAG TPA: hypothetical protein VGI81_20390, partial [Tepidisphaeraceae bacterium]